MPNSSEYSIPSEEAPTCMYQVSCMYVCPEAGQNSYMVGSGSFIVANAATLHGPQVKPNKRILV